MIDWYRLLHPIRARVDQAHADGFLEGLREGMPTNVHATATTIGGVVCKVVTFTDPFGDVHLRLRVGDVEHDFDDEEAALLGDGLEGAARVKYDSLPLEERRARAEAHGDVLVE